uniref:Neural proliferation, differentiation and control, 1b n=1 Tax=Pundamilia nyererei TaxID=303518 RepID=A0A3B4FBF8_9CICH
LVTVRAINTKTESALVPLVLMLLCCVVCSCTGSPLCPRSLECALAGRHFCRPGSSHCGPCLRPLVENSRGRCVVKRRHAPHTHSVKDKVSPYPELDEEIDFLSVCLIHGHSGVQLASIAGRRESCQRLVAVQLFGLETLSCMSTTVMVTCSGRNLLISPLPLVYFQLGDKKLAHSAQMYHYQHQKQQMLSLRKHRVEPKVPDSAASTDEENEDGDFTVYECPGLAPTGEMEVKNPLFDDSTLYLQRFHK